MFLFGVGILITNITGTFNLASSAKYKFSPFFIDVLLFLTILYLDFKRSVSERSLIAAYLAMIVIRFGLYLAFMANMIK